MLVNAPAFFVLEAVAEATIYAPVALGGFCNSHP